MKQYIQHKPSGEIIAVAIANSPEKFGIAPPYIEWDLQDRIDPSTCYVKDGQPVSKGIKPSERSVFDYAAEQWFEPEFDESEILIVAQQSRSRRDILLSACDWTQVADAPVDREAWAAYRQSLRDVTTQDGFPLNIIWPTPPNS